MKQAVVKGTEHNDGHFTVMLVIVREDDRAESGAAKRRKRIKQLQSPALFCTFLLGNRGWEGRQRQGVVEDKRKLEYI